MAGAAQDTAQAFAEFHASRSTVRDLVESGISCVPPLFFAPASPSTATCYPTDLAVPTVDLSAPHSASVPIVGAAARTCGFFYVTNHGVDADAAVSPVRAFHELPAAVRSAFYSVAFVGGLNYSTVPYMPGPGQTAAAAAPFLPWRASLRVLLQGPPAPDLSRLPAECRGALRDYARCVTEFGRKMARLLAEALGVGAMPVEAWVMACNYYPPCPEPARVVGSAQHTDPSLFTVISQDGVGGLQVRLNGGDNDGQWVDVPPVSGALLVNVGDLLKLLSNNEYHSVYHRVMVMSTEHARASLAISFNPPKPADSNLIGPLPELITTEKPALYRGFTVTDSGGSRNWIKGGLILCILCGGGLIKHTYHVLALIFRSNNVYIPR